MILLFLLYFLEQKKTIHLFFNLKYDYATSGNSTCQENDEFYVQMCSYCLLQWTWLYVAIKIHGNIWQ